MRLQAKPIIIVPSSSRQTMLDISLAGKGNDVSSTDIFYGKRNADQGGSTGRSHRWFQILASMQRRVADL